MLLLKFTSFGPFLVVILMSPREAYDKKESVSRDKTTNKPKKVNSNKNLMHVNLAAKSWILYVYTQLYWSHYQKKKNVFVVLIARLFFLFLNGLKEAKFNGNILLYIG